MDESIAAERLALQLRRANPAADRSYVSGA
jgi:hypothetical protein